MNQLYVYIYPYISSLLCLPPILSIPPLWLVTKHWADLPVLCSCFPLAIYLTFGSVYMSMPLSHFVPAYPSSSPCPQTHSLHLRPYSCAAPRFIKTIFFSFFFWIPYICVSTRYLFFSFLLHSVWQTLGPSTSLKITQFRFFLWLSNCTVYMCHTKFVSFDPFHPSHFKLCFWTTTKILCS